MDSVSGTGVNKANDTLRRQIVLLATLSSTTRWQTAEDILKKNSHYGLDINVIEYPRNDSERQLRETAKTRLECDIAALNADGNIIATKSEPGFSNSYRLEAKPLQTHRIFFSAQEAAWLDVALKFLDGKHQILRERIHGLTEVGSHSTVDFDSLLKIPLAAQQMYQAILERRRVSFQYKNRDGKISNPKNFEPWKLYFHRGFFYAQGKSSKHGNQPVVYHLQRFQSEVEFQISPHDSPDKHYEDAYEIPADIPAPSLEYYLDEPLILAIAPEQALELRQKGQKLDDNGLKLPSEMRQRIPAGWDVYQVEHAAWYRWAAWSLEFLDSVTVIAPDNLRQEVISAASHLQKDVQSVSKPRSSQLRPEGNIPSAPRKSVHKDNSNLLRTRFQAICSFINLNIEKKHRITYQDVAQEFGITVADVIENLDNASDWGAGESGIDSNFTVGVEEADDSLFISTMPVPDWVTAFGLPSQECIPLILSLETLSRYLPTRREEIAQAELKVLRWYLLNSHAKLETLGVDELSPELESKMYRLNQAIAQHRVVSFDYVDSRNVSGLAQVYPVELKAVRTRVELEAYNPQKQVHKWRTYWLERMQNLQVLDESYPEKLQRRQDKPPRPIFLKLDTAALPLADQIVEATIYRRDNSSMWVRLEAYDEDWLVRHLLSFGKALLKVSQSKDFPEVLEAIRYKASRALENYQV